MDIAQIQRLMQEQRFPEAAALLQQAVDAAPGDVNMRMGLAVAAFRGGDPVLARIQLEKILESDPAHALALFHLGFIEQMAGNVGAAERFYRAAASSQPDYADALYNLGLLLRSAGKHAEALACLQRARKSAPRHADIALMLAWSCLDNGLSKDAMEQADAAIDLRPGDASAWHALGMAWRYLDAYRTARKSLQQAAFLAPDRGDIARELAITLMEMGDYEASLVQFARATTLEPGNGEYRWRELLATCVFPDSAEQAQQACARFADGVEKIDAALAAEDPVMWAPAVGCAASISPFHLHYRAVDTTATTRRFAELVSRIARRACPELCQPLDWVARAHAGRLRVGFVCSAFREHTVARYFSAWMLGLDRARFEVFAWNVSAHTDEVTAQLAAGVDHFHQADALDMRELGQSIRRPHLDAIVYLDVGMEGKMQMLAAMRLAPVQCATYGHPVTTGLSNVDYYLSGAAMEPAEADEHYSERLIRLPGLGVVPTSPPEPGDGTWLQRDPGRPLLLCVQNIIKLAPQFDEIVARIAAATNAHIVFFESASHLIGVLRARLGKAFSTMGIDLDSHIRIEKKQKYEAYLGAIAKADLVLDSTHFSGGRSSLDVLSIGTPVVTLEGKWMRGRQTAAMLRIVGADELIVQDAGAYVATVAGLCADSHRRERLRRLILSNKHQLFEPGNVLPALENFLLGAEGVSISPATVAATIKVD